MLAALPLRSQDVRGADRVVFEVQLVQANTDAQNAIGRERKQRGDILPGSSRALASFRSTERTRVHLLKDDTVGDSLVGDQLQAQTANRLARLRLETRLGEEAVYLVGGRYPHPRTKIERDETIARRAPTPIVFGGDPTASPPSSTGAASQSTTPPGMPPLFTPALPGSDGATAATSVPPLRTPPLPGDNEAPRGPLQEFGARLSFSPIQMPDGSLRVRIRSIVRCVDFANSTVRNGFIEPATMLRTADRYQDVKPGQSFVLTGVFDRALLEDLVQIPGMETRRLLQQIRAAHDAQPDTSLVLVVTPRVFRESRR